MTQKKKNSIILHLIKSFPTKIFYSVIKFLNILANINIKIVIKTYDKGYSIISSNIRLPL